ncbi:hypothetical protein [Mycolicibacterium murale]|jgi:hypothetical protein|nr:hypothetical protein [Mycolicibacterium murale]MCV7186023.1 hypothetical protein [Mycolicibacterium murale]
MRPIVLGLAALGLFLGSLVMAPLSSEVAGSQWPAGHAVAADLTTYGC